MQEEQLDPVTPPRRIVRRLSLMLTQSPSFPSPGFFGALTPATPSKHTLTITTPRERPPSSLPSELLCTPATSKTFWAPNIDLSSSSSPYRPSDTDWAQWAREQTERMDAEKRIEDAHLIRTWPIRLSNHFMGRYVSRSIVIDVVKRRFLRVLARVHDWSELRSWTQMRGCDKFVKIDYNNAPDFESHVNEAEDSFIPERTIYIIAHHYVISPFDLVEVTLNPIVLQEWRYPQRTWVPFKSILEPYHHYVKNWMDTVLVKVAKSHLMMTIGPGIAVFYRDWHTLESVNDLSDEYSYYYVSNPDTFNKDRIYSASELRKVFQDSLDDCHVVIAERCYRELECGGILVYHVYQSLVSELTTTTSRATIPWTLQDGSLLSISRLDY